VEQEGQQTLLEFWLAATNYQLHFSSDPLEAQSDAVVLYDKYFSLQATSPLGFGDKFLASAGRGKNLRRKGAFGRLL
jgi:A-kinase anchor protein 10